MANLEIKHKENPKLQQNKLSDGRLSLYLEYYLGRTQWVDESSGKTKIKHDRKKEYLNLYLITNPKTPIERETNRKVLELAREIRSEKEQLLKAAKTGKRLAPTKKINFLDYYQSYLDNYTKADKRMIKASLERFKDFLKESYPIYQSNIKPEQLSKDMMVEFVEYLESKSYGEGALTFYKRFKKVIKYAVEHNVISKNPCNGVICRVDENALKKDILSVDEMKKLLTTSYEGQNPEIKRAFTFTLYTGIRHCDIINLKYSNVDYSNKLLSFEQTKTKGKSSGSWVNIPLNDGLLALIGEKPAKDDYIFKLPSQSMCLRALKNWTNKAQIDKNITWHSGRHSFAVNILNNGANIKTVASLLGHSGLKHTEKYTRAVDSLKETAINSLPKLNF
ncbi:MAG TPA: site-specific integrase [Paludibacter sp.]|nr:site-specific integrase [Paludibacter sp.]